MSNLEEEMGRIRKERIIRRSFPNNLGNISGSAEKDENSGCCEGIVDGGIKEIYDKDIDDIEKLLVELKKNEPTSDDQFFRLCIIGYEFGALQRDIVYAQRFKNDEKEKRIHLAHAKLDIADMVTQIQMLCLSLGFDFDKLRKLGVQHLKERHEDFKNQGWSEIK